MNCIAIGDVHGCAKTLRALLGRLDPQKDTHLVFVGDYIDRGPDSKGVIDLLIDLRARCRCTFLRGNHEAMMLAYLDGVDINGSPAGDLWSINGGKQTLGSYLRPDGQVAIPPAHVDFLRQTELYADHDDFFFVHAGLLPHLTVAANMDEDDENVYLWERSHLSAGKLAWEKPVVCGHTPHSDPINREQLLMIDTGCVYHLRPQFGRLCAVHLPARRFVYQAYCE